MSVRLWLSLCALSLIPIWATSVSAQGGGPGVIEHPTGGEVAEEEAGGMADVASMTPEEKEAYKQLLISKLVETRERMVGQIEDKLMAKQAEKNAFIADVLGWASLSGLLLLLMPLFLRKKYPRNDGLLVKYSVLASGTFTVSMLLFTLVLVMFRQVQGGMGAIANPQIALIEAGFTSMENNIDDMLEMAPWSSRPPWRRWLPARRTQCPSRC